MRVAWPADEDARLAAVAALDWPESDADPGLDEIAGLAATFLGMPIAIISLTGKDRQIAIAGRGLNLLGDGLRDLLDPRLARER